jgi:hypothetical protein
MLRVTRPLSVATLVVVLFATTGCSDYSSVADATNGDRAVKCEAIVEYETAENSRFAESPEPLRDVIHTNLMNACRQVGDVVVDRLYKRYELG